MPRTTRPLVSTLAFPYATVINQATGDASFFFAETSTVGVSASKGRVASGRPQVPRAVAPAAPPR